MLTTFTVYVEDKLAVLNRVASLFRRRGFNIESLTVGHSERAGISRMTIVVDTDSGAALRLEAELYKLVNVLEVENITHRPSVIRDLAMIRVATKAETRAELMHIATLFRARVVDVAADSLVIEATGSEDKIDGLVDLLRPYGVLEMVRTGRVAITRGARSATAAAGAGAGSNGKDLSEDDGISFSV
jgi:acetolactate synthase I/III small subunit